MRIEKTYKRSFWKASVSWALTFLGLLVIVFSNPLIGFVLLGFKSGGWFLVLTLSFTISILSIFIILPTQYTYVQITGEELIIRNAFYRFFKKRYSYNNITKVVIGNTGGFTNDYIQIFSGNKKSIMYGIDLISPRDYDALLADLRQRGVATETVNI